MAAKRSELWVTLLLALAITGCVTRTTADARARAAYMAGQQEAVARMQQLQTQGPSVTINGEVRNRFVPWTEGMTLAKALVEADYCGATEPAEVIIVHGGIGRRYDLKQLLKGVDVPLQPGDVVQLLSQSAAPRR
jgi:hypothetical protein